MTLVVFSVICAVCCFKVAKSKGRNPKIWALFGFFSNIIALIVILLLPNLLTPQNPQIPNQVMKPNWLPPPKFPMVAAKIRQNLNALRRKSPPVTDIAAQIRELAQLRNDGLISDAEYQDKRQKLLDII